MKKSLALPFALVVVAVLVAAFLRHCSRDSGAASTERGLSGAAPTQSDIVAETPFATPGDADGEPGNNESIEPHVVAAAEIRSALAALKAGAPVDQAAQILARLRRLLLELPPEEAAAAVLEFLANGLDTPSGLSFRVGADGVLASAPTLRTMLLDVLPTLDPDAALAAARDIIGRRQSQDEYAMALRNIAWNDLDGDMSTELSTGFSAMLDQPGWQADPSDGFHEAFDVAVELGSAAMLEELAELVGGQKPAGSPAKLGTERAAFMALDRIAQRQPAALVEIFSRDPDFLAHAPRHRAALMTRLDPRVPEQRALLVRYLERQDHRQRELEYFAGLFPNANYIKGYRLVTSDEDIPDIAERQQTDREMLAVMREIAPSLSSPGAQSAASTILERLEYFAHPAQ